jgi:hypothetical protein
MEAYEECHQLEPSSLKKALSNLQIRAENISGVKPTSMICR